MGAGRQAQAPTGTLWGEGDREATGAAPPGSPQNTVCPCMQVAPLSKRGKQNQALGGGKAEVAGPRPPLARGPAGGEF